MEKTGNLKVKIGVNCDELIDRLKDISNAGFNAEEYMYSFILQNKIANKYPRTEILLAEYDLHRYYKRKLIKNILYGIR